MHYLININRFALIYCDSPFLNTNYTPRLKRPWHFLTVYLRATTTTITLSILHFKCRLSTPCLYTGMVQINLTHLLLLLPTNREDSLL